MVAQGVVLAVGLASSLRSFLGTVGAMGGSWRCCAEPLGGRVRLPFRLSGGPLWPRCDSVSAAPPTTTPYLRIDERGIECARGQFLWSDIERVDQVFDEVGGSGVWSLIFNCAPAVRASQQKPPISTDTTENRSGRPVSPPSDLRPAFRGAGGRRLPVCSDTTAQPPRRRLGDNSCVTVGRSLNGG